MKLSVAVVTYNHERFIARALDSALMQKTNFDFEIVVGEDCSQDRTRAIVKEYEKRFSGKLKALYHPQNLRSTGGKNNVEVYRACRGEYIAILDGDDWWTDPYKLQKQIECLDDHPLFSMCFTDFNVVDDAGDVVSRNGWRGRWKRNLTHELILREPIPRASTSVFRRAALPGTYPEEYFKAFNGDNFIFGLISRHGDAAYLDFVSTSYRVHEGGIWSSKTPLERRQVQFATTLLMRKCFGDAEEQKALSARMTRQGAGLLAYYLRTLDFARVVGVIRNVTESGPIETFRMLSLFVKRSLRNLIRRLA